MSIEEISQLSDGDLENIILSSNQVPTPTIAPNLWSHLKGCALYGSHARGLYQPNPRIQGHPDISLPHGKETVLTESDWDIIIPASCEKNLLEFLSCQNYEEKPSITQPQTRLFFWNDPDSNQKFEFRIVPSVNLIRHLLETVPAPQFAVIGLIGTNQIRLISPFGVKGVDYDSRTFEHRQLVGSVWDPNAFVSQTNHSLLFHLNRFVKGICAEPSFYYIITETCGWNEFEKRACAQPLSEIDDAKSISYNLVKAFYNDIPFEWHVVRGRHDETIAGILSQSLMLPVLTKASQLSGNNDAIALCRYLQRLTDEKSLYFYLASPSQRIISHSSTGQTLAIA